MAANDAESILRQFIIAMNKWEVYFLPLMIDPDLFQTREQDVKEQMRKEVIEIFEKFCTKKERKQGRPDALSCCDPPEYSLNEEILKSEVGKNKVSIYTQQHVGFKNQYRYTLHFKKNEWRIDKKERLNTSDNKWERDYL